MAGKEVSTTLSLSQSQSWSELPTELLEVIFSHLKKTDLQNVRLVCKSWNAECVKVLQKPQYEFYQTLTERNIKKYIDFVCDPEYSHQIRLKIPFHLNITFRIEDKNISSELKNLVDSVESLRLLFGEESFAKLTLRRHAKDYGHYPPNIGYLLNQLDTLSLTKLPINFCKLQSLLLGEIKINPTEVLNRFSGSPDSPILHNLSFSLERPQEGVDTGIIFHDILRCVSSTLKSLTIKVPYDRNTKNILLMTFPILPKLQHLRLDVRTGGLIFIKPAHVKFNPESLPSLKSLVLPFGVIFSDMSTLVDEIESCVVFPSVHNLTILLNYPADQYPVSDDSLVLRHFQNVFPNMSSLGFLNESIEVKYQKPMRFLLHHLFESTWSKNIQQFHIEGFEEDYFGDTLKFQECSVMFNEKMKKMESEFNARENKNDGLDWEKLLALLRSSTHPDYLFIPSESFSDVRKIRLGLSTFTHKACVPDDPFSFPPTPNLTLMGVCCPHLEIIEISEIYLGRLSEEGRKELFQNLRSKFPNLEVHVTSD